MQTYGGWDDSYKLDGIFFDEAANEADKVDTYAGYASQARESFPDGIIVYNPGTNCDAGYFDSADLVVTAEYSYGDFQ